MVTLIKWSRRRLSQSCFSWRIFRPTSSFFLSHRAFAHDLKSSYTRSLWRTLACYSTLTYVSIARDLVTSGFRRIPMRTKFSSCLRVTMFSVSVENARGNSLPFFSHVLVVFSILSNILSVCQCRSLRGGGRGRWRGKDSVPGFPEFAIREHKKHDIFLAGSRCSEKRLSRMPLLCTATNDLCDWYCIRTVALYLTVWCAKNARWVFSKRGFLSPREEFHLYEKYVISIPVITWEIRVVF